MDFENTRRKLIQLAKQLEEADSEDSADFEDIEIAASVCLLEYCIANNEAIIGVDFHKLLKPDEESEDYEKNFNARHEFISQVYYKEEIPYIEENISMNAQQLATAFFETQEN